MCVAVPIRDRSCVVDGAVVRRDDQESLCTEFVVQVAVFLAHRMLVDFKIWGITSSASIPSYQQSTQLESPGTGVRLTAPFPQNPRVTTTQALIPLQPGKEQTPLILNSKPFSPSHHPPIDPTIPLSNPKAAVQPPFPLCTPLCSQPRPTKPAPRTKPLQYPPYPPYPTQKLPIRNASHTITAPHEQRELGLESQLSRRLETGEEGVLQDGS